MSIPKNVTPEKHCSICLHILAARFHRYHLHHTCKTEKRRWERSCRCRWRVEDESTFSSCRVVQSQSRRSPLASCQGIGELACPDCDGHVTCIPIQTSNHIIAGNGMILGLKLFCNVVGNYQRQHYVLKSCDMYRQSPIFLPITKSLF